MLSSPLQSLPALQENIPLALIEPYIPQQALIIHGARTITQREFLRDVQRLARHLPDSGYALNLCEDRYYFLLAFCALLTKGAVNLLPPNRQASTLAELAKDYPDCYCLFDKSQPCALENFIVSDLLDREELAVPELAPPLIPPQQLAAIAFTSGSTGSPKPNSKTWGTFAATARMLGQRITHTLSLPTIVATVPAQHMYGLEIVMMTLQANVIMHSGKPFYPAEVQQLLAQLAGPAILVSTPTHLRAMTQSEINMPALAGVISATAPLDPPLAVAAERCFSAPLWEIYGCTEAGAMATRRSTQTQYWTLLQGFRLASDGEHYTASAPHLNEVAPIQDQLTVNASGEFLLAGRSSDMINVAGKRSSLAHLTLQLLRIEGVDDGVVFLPPQSDAAQGERRPVALVVSNLPEKQILAALAQTIDAVFLPRPLRKVNRLPRSETGKLTAAVLSELWSQASGK